ncbi:UDP-glycosyltransferase [Winogradskyella sp.]|uniref:UDP-glycosyltransferase n=1 Tax=Winogradskyella sp. TaxID=1883156 RepID=UPI003BADB6E4
MTPTKKHILFVVPDGVGIKNFLYSDIIKYLKEECDISIWSPLPLDAFDDVRTLHQINFNYKQLTLKPESAFTRLYREATTYARLLHNTKLKTNATILTNWRRPKRGFKIKLLYRIAEVMGRYLSKDYGKILKYEDKYKKHISKKDVEYYVNELKLLEPSALFITHQRVPGIMPICLAAKQINIKTATAIFSWDNLPKARLAVYTDLYLVWSQWMKEEMKDYYPEISQENVQLVGTPQFEFYLDKNRITPRDEFADKHGLDPNKKWICFSGDDVTTSPYDALFLRDVAQALEAEKHNLQIIFRRCPVDFSSRYDDALETYKDFIISIDPKWNNQAETGWAGFFPMYEDINLQINLAKHCELVTNLGSTMAVDFATFNKPCLYLNYNPSNDSSWSTEIIYKFQHFRSMKNLDAVGWINSKEDIHNTILKTLDNPNHIAMDRKEWIEDLVLHPLDQNSEKIARALL